MIGENAKLIRDGYVAFGQGDIPAVLGLFDEDITWHVPGRSPLSGDYRGRDGVLGFFTKAVELSGGTLKVAADEVVADGDRVVVLSTGNRRAARQGAVGSRGSLLEAGRRQGGRVPRVPGRPAERRRVLALMIRPTLVSSGLSR